MRSVKSIVKIKDCPSFVEFKPESNLSYFGQYNVIYGWNGSGKTTLSRILRSFESGDNYFGDRTNPGQFEFNLDDNTSINQDNLSSYKNIRVFNSDFVRESVFCLGGPKPIFYLGRENKENKEKIIDNEKNLESLKSNLNENQNLFTQAVDNKEKSLSATAKKIKEALTTTRQDKYRNYDKTSLENAIKTHSSKLLSPEGLKLSDEKLESIQKAIQQNSKDKITNINPIDLDLKNEFLEITEIINRSITSKVIENLKSDEQLSPWVEQGLILHKVKQLKKCAFCDQAIPSNRIEQLENHFNTEYQKLIDDIKILKDKLYSKKISIMFPDQSSFYDDLSAQYNLEKAKCDNLIEIHNSNINILLGSLDNKQKNVFKNPKTPDVKSSDEDSLKKLNEIIDLHNIRTDNFDKQTSSDKERLEWEMGSGTFSSFKLIDTITAWLDYQGLMLVEKYIM